MNDKYWFMFIFSFISVSILFGQASCSASIDSVWFFEETMPNDSNIVQICYILSSDCPDSLFDVNVRVSADSGASWVNVGEGWFSTLTDTAGDLGTVDTGTHCFYWIMSEDTIAEGANWIIGVSCYFVEELTMFWPMFHYDAQNTGRSPYVLCSDESLSVLWSIPTGSPVKYSAVSCGSSIYFSTSDGILHCVKYDGTNLWTASTGASTRSGPAVLDDGSIVLGNSNGTMTCFNTDGSVRWTWTSSLSTSPCGLWHCPTIGPDGRIHTAGDHGFSCWEGSHICLAQDGTLQWERDIPASGDGCYCSPAVDLDSLSFTTDIGNDPRGALTCYNINGTIRWRWNSYATGGEVDINSSPTVDLTRDRIYFGSNRAAKGLVAVDYDPSGGSPSMAWFYSTSPRDINWCVALDWDGNIYIGTNDGGTGNSILYSFSPDGSVRWQHSIACGYLTDPVVDTAGHIIVGSSNGYLFVFNADGDSLTSIYLGGNVNSPILGAGGNIYVGTSGNMFYAVGCEILSPLDSVCQLDSSSLDSRPPDISISCPEYSVAMVGDTLHFEWQVIDSFLVNDQCSVKVSYCGAETNFVVSDTFFDFVIPPEAAGCSFAYFVVAATDSFYNWGYDTCFFTVPCSISLDSVWFSEETDCNDSNIVRICYVLSSDCSDSLFDISIRISPDSGLTWVDAGEDWFTTFADTAGDVGGGVIPGTHCFDWIMSNDFPYTEGYDWMVVVSASNPLFADSFSTLDSALYQINGNDGFVAADSEYFVLTQNNTWRNGRLMTVDTFFCDTLDIRFRFKFVPGWCDVSDDSTGADGISLIFSPLLNPPLSPGGSIGIMGSAGWGVEFDTYNNYCGSPQSDISGNHIAVSIDSVACLFVGTDSVPVSLEQANIPFDMVDNNWHDARVIVEYPHCRVILDGVIYIDSDFSDLPAPFWAHIGFSASTGDCYSEHIIDNIVVDDPRTIDTLNCSDTAYAPLDSHEPIVSIICPENFIYSAGDSVSLHWTIDDLFWRNDIGTLFVSYDTVNLEFLVSDTIAEIEIPAACGSISVAVAVRDSFCNWGYDTCSFGICSQFLARLECPPLDIFTSCENQTINIIAIDTICHSSIDSVYFTMKIISSTGDTNSMNLIGPSSNINLEFLGDTIRISIHDIDFSDGDSIAATLDSIRDINGCIIVPDEF